MENAKVVIPAQAGIQLYFPCQEISWTPAFAGVTDCELLRVLLQISARKIEELRNMKNSNSQFRNLGINP